MQRCELLLRYELENNPLPASETLTVRAHYAICRAILAGLLDACFTRGNSMRTKSETKMSSAALPMDKHGVQPSRGNLTEVQISTIGKTKSYAVINLQIPTTGIITMMSLGILQRDPQPSI